MTNERKAELFDRVMGLALMYLDGDPYRDPYETLGNIGMTDDEIDEILFEDDEPDLDDEDYVPSSTNGDYSPGNPWDAPGMKMSDFI